MQPRFYIITLSLMLSVGCAVGASKPMPYASADSIFKHEMRGYLPEVVVESRHHQVLHILAYVREYSTLTTYSDSVFLFREKMVDFMLPQKKNKFTGWRLPRILKSKSYYRFSNAAGLDSVSDRCNNHFSWSDWIGVNRTAELPYSLQQTDSGKYVLRGKYSPREVWVKNNDRVALDIDVLADTSSRKWVQSFYPFFKKNLEFDNFRLCYSFYNSGSSVVSPIDCIGYTVDIESNGRGMNMFRFNRIDQDFFVNTHAEVYLLDKEYITFKEAKRLSSSVNSDEIEITEPIGAPKLQPDIVALMDRVNSVDKDKTRLAFKPDPRFVPRNTDRKNQNLGQRALSLLKSFVGISSMQAARNQKRQWNEFKRSQIHINDSIRKAQK